MCPVVFDQDSQGAWRRERNSYVRLSRTSATKQSSAAAFGKVVPTHSTLKSVYPVSIIWGYDRFTPT